MDLSGIDFSAVHGEAAAPAQSTAAAPTELPPNVAAELDRIAAEHKSDAPKKGKAAAADDEPAEFDRETVAFKVKILLAAIPKLKALKPRGEVDALSDEKLQALYEKINMTLGAQTSIEGMARTVPMMVKAIEDVIAMLSPLRLQGTHRCLTTEDGQALLIQCAVEAGMGNMNMPPHTRLALMLAQGAANAHMINSMAVAVAAPPKPTSAPSPTAPIEESDRPNPPLSRRFDSL